MNARIVVAIVVAARRSQIPVAQDFSPAPDVTLEA
jgi:hypothetical protein